MQRKLRSSWPALLALSCFIPCVSSAQVKLLRHPTYAAGKVAFSYLGDIWIASENGGDIQRLTDNKARDVYPRFSPDGKSIAFSSNRDGNYDVFVMPVSGGKPKQLTFHSADDNVVGWTPDGKKVLFSSVRAKGAFPSVATLFEVSVEGGTEAAGAHRLGRERELFAGWQQDGLHAASGGVVAKALPRRLRGRSMGEGRVRANTFTKLGDAEFKGNYLWPMYGAKRRDLFRQRPDRRTKRTSSSAART